MQRTWWIAPAAVALCAAAWPGAGVMGTAQQRPAAAPAAPAGPSGALLRAFDADKDGSLTAGELSGTFDRWYTAADTTKTGAITAQQLGEVVDAAMPAEAECGGRSATPRVPCQPDLDAMLAALPDSAPAKPKKPRQISSRSSSR